MNQSVMVEKSPDCEGFKVMASQISEDGLDFVDENEEWAKIEKVMASLDTGLSNDVNEVEGNVRDILEGGDLLSGLLNDAHFSNGHSTSSSDATFPTFDKAFSDWLASLHLSKYEHLLISNGFDDLRFVGPEVMSDPDLIEIGMTDERERMKLVQAAAKLRHSITYSSSTFRSVKEWLTSLKLMDYYETFIFHGCTDIEHLVNIWDLQLTSVFHISRLGHLNRIMASINSFRSNNQKKLTQINSRGGVGVVKESNLSYENHNGTDAATTTNNISRSLNDILLQRLNYYNNDTSSSGQAGEVSLYKDYSSLKSNKSGKSSTSSTLRRQGESQVRQSSEVITLEEVLRNCGAIDPSIMITPASSPSASSSLASIQVPTTMPPSSFATASNKILSSPTTSSSHSNLVNHSNLGHFNGQSNFSVLYLGSVKLPSIDRPDLARKCIEQIRLSPVESRRVVVMVSHKKVVFKDQNSHEILGAHDVSNIFCVCQDSELLEYFAFVTWDAIESVHFCHVFNAHYLQLSTDVVMALGRAFEVAFQQLQQDQQNVRQNTRSSPPPSQPIIDKMSTFV